MKRFVGVACAMVIASLAMAQQNFTIRRPAEGSTVREVVNVRFPKDSVPAGWYIGIKVNGKFLEAVLPETEGDDYVYKLDTKARGLADGPLSIEAILYADPGDRRPQVANRTQVNVTLDNRTSIRVPEDGFRLRYSFPVGREFIYRAEIGSTVSILSQAQAQLGSRAAEIPTSLEIVRFLYAVDNGYGSGANREGMVRLQILPSKGKDYAWLTTRNSNEPTKWYDYQMHPIFMRLTSTGREVFTSFPTYFPMDGTTGDSARTDLYGLFPLPILPERGIRPGDAFSAAFSTAAFSLEEKDTMEKVSVNIPGRGVFESVEWQNGRPTAKFTVSAAMGARELTGAAAQLGGIPQRIESKSTIWFDLNLGMVIRFESSEIQEILIESQAPAATGGPEGGPGSGGGPDSGGKNGLPRMGGASAGWISNKPFGPGQWNLNPSGSELDRQGQPGRGRPGGQPGGTPGGRGEQGRRGGPPGMGGADAGGGQFGAGGRGAGGGAGAVRQIARIVSRSVFELE